MDSSSIQPGQRAGAHLAAMANPEPAAGRCCLGIKAPPVIDDQLLLEVIVVKAVICCLIRLPLHLGQRALFFS
jgi:hypothetical protein